jgi:excinuclease ABC subunit C
MSDDSESALAHYLSDRAGYRVHVRTPERGDLKALCSLVYDNAAQYAKQYKAESEKDNKTLVKLASMLSLEVIPERIESFDISNMGSENVTAGMVVTMNTKFVKSEYRTYKIAHLNTPDDYGAMKEAVSRRLKNHGETVPDLILLDGGKGHVSTIKALLAEMNLAIPVFGMVKDDFHKTRALTSESEEISIAREQPVFQFIYKIQEETHRYAITQMTNSRSRAVKMSSLEKINGIGGVKAKELLRHFKTVANLKSASLEELTEVKNITQKNAEAIIEYYKNKIDNGLKP